MKNNLNTDLKDQIRNIISHWNPDRVRRRFKDGSVSLSGKSMDFEGVGIGFAGKSGIKIKYFLSGEDLIKQGKERPTCADVYMRCGVYTKELAKYLAEQRTLPQVYINKIDNFLADSFATFTDHLSILLKSNSDITIIDPTFPQIIDYSDGIFIGTNEEMFDIILTAVQNAVERDKRKQHYFDILQSGKIPEGFELDFVERLQNSIIAENDNIDRNNLLLQTAIALIDKKRILPSFSKDTFTTRKFYRTLQEIKTQEDELKFATRIMSQMYGKNHLPKEFVCYANEADQTSLMLRMPKQASRCMVM